MIDSDDADSFWLAGVLTEGWVSVVCLIIFVILACVAWSNSEDCKSRHCPDGQSAKLMQHECLCVTVAQGGE